jgi:hypothetical protein
MVKIASIILAIAFLIPAAASAQTQSESETAGATARILDKAAQHIGKGETCYRSGDLECARREFDSAVDAFLESGVDVRSDARLQLGWREMIEKINRYETAPSTVNGVVGWKTQEFDGRPPQPPAEQADSDAGGVVSGPLTAETFQLKFSDLRKSFREKYGRDITITGADHGEHRRLYGRGSAYDIRARDLNREQVKFIIATGSKLGLRIKDFSTWDKVAAHNARTITLGRPLDTLATGVHLHIDRMASPKKSPYSATPAISKVRRKSDESKRD